MYLPASQAAIYPDAMNGKVASRYVSCIAHGTRAVEPDGMSTYSSLQQDKAKAVSMNNCGCMKCCTLRIGLLGRGVGYRAVPWSRPKLWVSQEVGFVRARARVPAMTPHGCGGAGHVSPSTISTPSSQPEPHTCRSMVQKDCTWISPAAARKDSRWRALYATRYVHEYHSRMHQKSILT